MANLGTILNEKIQTQLIVQVHIMIEVDCVCLVMLLTIMQSCKTHHFKQVAESR